MSRQRLNFVNNSLSKLGYLKAILNILFFRSSILKKRTTEEFVKFLTVDPERLFFFGAGRMGVYTLLKSLNFTEKDEVIVAGYTCVVVTNAVKFAGCQVRYVDIDPNTLNLNTELLFESINNKTKAIIIPHNFGVAFNEIRKIKTLYPEIILIEDAAHCLGSSDSQGELCGTIADAGFYSFEYSKPITCGLGGVMVINNPILMNSFTSYYKELPTMSKGNVFKIILTLGAHNLAYFKSTSFFYRNIFRILRLFNLVYVTSEEEISGDKPADYPVRLNDSLYCFLWPQITQIDDINAKKRALVETYFEAFGEFKDLRVVNHKNSVLVRYPLVFADYISSDKVNNIRQEAMTKGINLGVWFNDVVHPSGSFRYCYQVGSCHVGESISKRIINLPVNINYADMTNEIEDLVRLLKQHQIN
jgi:perosamine synthetase